MWVYLCGSSVAALTYRSLPSATVSQPPAGPADRSTTCATVAWAASSWNAWPESSALPWTKTLNTAFAVFACVLATAAASACCGGWTGFVQPPARTTTVTAINADFTLGGCHETRDRSIRSQHGGGRRGRVPDAPRPKRLRWGHGLED